MTKWKLVVAKIRETMGSPIWDILFVLAVLATSVVSCSAGGA